jgi:hypothetical protein
MRAADRRECAAFGRTPHQALHYSLNSSSFALTAFVDNVPHAMFGLVPFSIANGIGRPWFLGTDEVYRHPREMISQGSFLVELMLDSFPRLENVVALDNVRAIRLLRAWDFVIGVDEQLIGGVRFLPFWRERQPCVIRARLP